jgi:hypothetical protein
MKGLASPPRAPLKEAKCWFYFCNTVKAIHFAIDNDAQRDCVIVALI